MQVSRDRYPELLTMMENRARNLRELGEKVVNKIRGYSGVVNLRMIPVLTNLSILWVAVSTHLHK